MQPHHGPFDTKDDAIAYMEKRGMKPKPGAFGIGIEAFDPQENAGGVVHFLTKRNRVWFRLGA